MKVTKILGGVGHGQIKLWRYYLNEWPLGILSKWFRNMIYFLCVTTFVATPWVLTSQGGFAASECHSWATCILHPAGEEGQAWSDIPHWNL